MNAHASDASTTDMNVRDASENIKFNNGPLGHSETPAGLSLNEKKNDIDNLVFPIEAGGPKRVTGGS